MNKKALLFIIAVLFFCVIKAQTYNPFDIKNMQWYVQTCYPINGNTNNHQYNNYTYTICNDSVIINNKRYRTIYSKIYSYGTYSLPNTGPITFYGYFRQDSILKRSYLRRTSWGIDSLLMDYNLSVGDTIKRGFYFYSAVAVSQYYGPIIVQSIATQTLNGIAVKCFYTNGVNQPYFIEGVGHSYGIFANNSPAETYTWPFERCSHMQSISSTTNCLSIINTLPKIKNDNIFINIYPTPTNDILNIDLSEEPIKNSKIEIINLMGQVVLTAKINNQKAVLNISEFPQGLYYLKLTTGNSDFTKIVLIEH